MLISRYHSCEQSQVPEVRLGETGLSVADPILWPFNSPSSLYENDGSGASSFSSVRILSPSIAGRLIDFGSFEAGVKDSNRGSDSTVLQAVDSIWQKSSLNPTQSKSFLGIEIRSTLLKVFPTEKRIVNPRSAVQALEQTGAASGGAYSLGLQKWKDLLW